MDTLFDVSRSGLVSLEDVDGLQGIPPQIWIWLRRLFFSGDLELVAQTLADAGWIKKGHEAPAFLAEIVAPATQRTRNVSVSFGDLQRLNHTRLHDFLRNQLGGKVAEEEPTPFELYTTLGRISHRFAEWLYTHHVRLTEPKQSSWLEDAAAQDNLFETIAEPDNLFGAIGDFASPPAENRRRFDQRFLTQMAEKIRAFASLLESPNAYAARYFSIANDIVSFQAEMRATFPEQYALLMTERINPNIPPALATLAGWMGLLERRLHQDRSIVSLTEVPVSPRHAEVWAGRIDRLDVLDGKTDAFRNLQRQYVDSASDFVEQALLLHPPTRFRIVDWKFSVGDFRDKMIPDGAFGNNTAVSQTEQDWELSRALAKHASQVQWYILWLALRHEIVNGRSGKKLPDGNRFTGIIVYVLPNGKLVDVPVEPAPEELQRRFVEQVVYHWQAINGKRDARVLNNAATVALRNHIGNGDHHDNGNGTHGADASADAAPPSVQTSFIAEGFEYRPVRALVDSYRHFVGTADTIQEIRIGEEVRYRMHLGRLAHAIEAGEIAVRSGFSWDRGGFICCLLHKEKTPSMHLAFEQGIFHCFGCGASGTFALEDLPANLATVVPPEHIGARRMSSSGLPEISEETQKIMATAQEILAGNFPGSMAESYLVGTRFIDRDLARSAGAGCAVRGGADVLIDELLGAGYSLDNLVSKGFLNYSDRAKSWSPAVRALRKHGISDDIIVCRKRKKTLAGGTVEVTLWPFSTLSGRATFPLSLPIASHAVVTGFYGRHATGEKSNLPHLVLTPEDVPKGMFNGQGVAEYIADGGLEKVYLTEAIIDALVLTMLGYGPAVSIVGTAHTNHLRRLILALNPGEINVALDFDSAGKESTTAGRSKSGKIKGIIPWLHDAGYGGELVDFSSAFMLYHPEITQCGYDDYNKWWTDHGRHHRRSF